MSRSSRRNIDYAGINVGGDLILHVTLVVQTLHCNITDNCCFDLPAPRLRASSWNMLVALFTI